ncbi:MAG: type I methionyl aminopeptidase [Bacillati bacterium ANGP1]|uniref:Methionine aminopeptidase n=1 Tax=Candidatus Segetimicrobium genomatis TaxID=2569760 RepID=A0A537JX32_9BACT|nr:MAG: type I methionyl aminopeptidase [Terrabacteria group bacterium ANGP1]
MIMVKTATDLAAMRRAGQAAAQALQMVVAAVRPGATTAQLDRIAEARIRELGGEPSFLGYRGFPASICTSVNDEVVHGIPGPRRLVEGEIISLDLGVVLDGFHGDLAVTVPVGRVSPAVARLLRVTAEALEIGIRAIRPEGRLGDVGAAIQRYVEQHGFSVVREFAGHGIGRKLHEDPQIPNFGSPGNGVVLRRGMTLAIEPMVNMGTSEVVMEADGWTVRTRDHKPSAHFEHTVAVGDDGPIVLTRLSPDESV